MRATQLMQLISMFSLFLVCCFLLNNHIICPTPHTSNVIIMCNVAFTRIIHQVFPNGLLLKSPWLCGWCDFAPPVLPTTVLDSSDSLSLSFQSWEDTGFLGHPGILPSCPSHTTAHAVRRIPWCPLRHRPPCCPEDPFDIPGSSLGVPSDTGPHPVE